MSYELHYYTQSRQTDPDPDHRDMERSREHTDRRSRFVYLCQSVPRHPLDLIQRQTLQKKLVIPERKIKYSPTLQLVVPKKRMHGFMICEFPLYIHSPKVSPCPWASHDDLSRQVERKWKTKSEQKLDMGSGCIQLVTSQGNEAVVDTESLCYVQLS